MKIEKGRSEWSNIIHRFKSTSRYLVIQAGSQFGSSNQSKTDAEKIVKIKIIQ